MGTRTPSDSERVSVRKRAVLAGTIVDIAGTYGVSLCFFLAFVMRKPDMFQDAPAEELVTEFSEGFMAALFFTGILFTVLGGFVAGKVAKRAEVKHALVTGGVVLVLGLIVSIAAGTDSVGPVWLAVLGFLATLPAAAFGGYLAKLSVENPAT